MVLRKTLCSLMLAVAVVVGVVAAGSLQAATPLADSSAPPASPVKLIFVHHSTGGNWLADTSEHESAGGLGRALMDNNYFVSATNYGWQAGDDAVGDRTDIGQWWDWFRGGNSATVTSALFRESGQNTGDFGSWGRLADPGGENEIIMFKSCFPNSHLGGGASDPPATGDNPLRGQDAWAGDTVHSVANAKGIYNDLLQYFQTRQDKLFVVITAPPLLQDDMYQPTDAAHAANARGFNDWLVDDWLSTYAHDNVAVFDFFNVLTSNGGSPTTNDEGALGGNHHRWRAGAVQHTHPLNNNYSAYGSGGDSHPTGAGGQKATSEILPLLNVWYNRWSGSAPAPTRTSAPPSSTPTDERNTSTSTHTARATPTYTGRATATRTPATGQQTLVLQHGVSPNASYKGCADALISKQHSEANLGGLEHVEVFWEEQESRRSILRFDLSALSSEATVQSAVLELYRSDGDSASEMTIAAFRVTGPWVEGTGWGLDPPFSGDGVTWQSASPGVPWSSPGGEHDTSTDYGHGANGIAGQVQLPSGLSNGWVRLDITPLVAAWSSGRVMNHGLLIRPLRGDYTYHYFDSRNHGTAANRPKLTIKYTVGTVSPTATPTELERTAIPTVTRTATRARTPLAPVDVHLPLVL